MNKTLSSKTLAAVAAVAIILLAAVATLAGGSPVAYAQTSPLPTPPGGQTPVPTTSPLPTALPTAIPTSVSPTSVPPTAVPPTGVPPTAVPPYYGIRGYHTVRYQETLFCIGRAYGVNPWAIASQNGLAYPYYLYVGQVLAIPNAPWVNMTPGPSCTPQFGGGAPPVPPVQPVPPSGCRASYTVRCGDTLSSIAWRYGSTVWAIAARNGIYNTNLIFSGQVLCIP
jgi:LysM repeat protein